MTNTDINASHSTESSTLEKKETPAKFFIELLPIKDKKDKFSYLTNLSLIKNLTVTELKNLGLKLNDKNDFITTDNRKTFLVLKQNLIGIGNKHKTLPSIKIEDFMNSHVLLFQAKEIEIDTGILIITTTDNLKFYGNIESYLLNGLQSLMEGTDNKIKEYLITKKKEQTYNFQKPLLTIKTSKKTLNTGADDYCITSEEQKEFCVLKDNTIATYNYTDDAINNLSDYYDLSNYGTVKQIRTDINNNFYFIITEQDEKSQLRILNRNSLEEVMQFVDLTKIVHLSNEQGKLLCMDKDGYLRIITINTKQLPRGYVDHNPINAETQKQTVIKIEDKARSDLKQTIETGLTLELNENGTTPLSEDAHTDEVLRQKLRDTKITIPHHPEDATEGNEDENKKSENNKQITLKQLFISATSLPDINQVYTLAQQLKLNPKVAAVKGLIDPIIQEISEKKAKIRLETISQSLQHIVEHLPTASDFSDFLTIKQQLAEIKKERSQILVADKAFDVLLKETMQSIEEKIKEYQTTHQEEIMQMVEENLKTIQKALADIDHLPHINEIIRHPVREQTKKLLTYLPDEEKNKLEEKLQQIKKQRQNVLKALAHNEFKDQQQAQAKKLLELENSLKEIKDVILSINEEETLEQVEKSDPLVLATKQELETLPATQKVQELSLKLEQMFKERALSIKFSKEENTTSFKTLDQYGIPKALYFVPEIEKKVKRDIYAKPLPDEKYRLQFHSSAGNIIEPNLNKKILGNYKFVYTEEEFIDLKNTIHQRTTNGTKKTFYELLKKPNKSDEEQQTFAQMEQKYYIPRMIDIMNTITGEGKLRNLHQRKNLPHMDSKTVITPSIQGRLGERGNRMTQQLVNHQGYMIIESDAGTGKNFKVDLIGKLTNREIFDISCNAHMEKEDLLFSPEINTDGTYRQPSELIRGIQTPGAIILLDEVNTLKPGVAKLLNPLLDGRRYINDPQLGKIHVHPSVIIIGAMNPRDYLGTNPLPQEQVSRATFVNDDYLPAEEEAFMISKHLAGAVSSLTWEEFKTYRENYNIRDEKPNNKTLYHLFKAMQKVVNIANKLRDIRMKTQRGKAEIGEELEWLFSPRESIQIIQDYNTSKDIHKSINRIVLPKIADLEQREYAQKIIEEVMK